MPDSRKTVGHVHSILSGDTPCHKHVTRGSMVGSIVFYEPWTCSGVKMGRLAAGVQRHGADPWCAAVIFQVLSGWAQHLLPAATPARKVLREF